MQTERLSSVITDLVVTLDEVKEHLVVDHDADDKLITRQILAAIAFAESRCELSLRLRRYRCFGPCWPAQGVRLRYGPVRQLDKVAYIDTDNIEQTLGADTFQLVPHFGDYLLHFLEAPPGITSGRLDAVSVSYTAGYGTVPSETVNTLGYPYTLPIVLGNVSGLDETSEKNRLPDNIRQAIYMLVGHWYENREEVVVGTSSSPVAVAAEALLQQERILGV